MEIPASAIDAGCFHDGSLELSDMVVKNAGWNGRHEKRGMGFFLALIPGVRFRKRRRKIPSMDYVITGLTINA